MNDTDQLLTAAIHGRTDELRELLARGVPFAVRSTHNGMTPIEAAAYYDRIACVEMLLDAGASVAAEETWPGPLDLALLREHQPIVELLVSRGAVPSKTAGSPWPPKDWTNVEGWNAYHRHSALRSEHTTALTMPMSDFSVLRNLWRPHGPKKRMLILGNGISFLPRFVAAMGDDVVALDVSPVATTTAETQRVHGSLLDWFLKEYELERPSVPRGEKKWICGDALRRDSVEGPFDLVFGSRFFHGFDDRELGILFDNVRAWLAPNTGDFHLVLQGGAPDAFEPLLSSRGFATGSFADERVGAAPGGERRAIFWCFGG